MVIKVTSWFKGLGGRGEFVTKLLRMTIGMSGLCSTLRCICILHRNPSVNDRLCGLVVRVSGYRYRGPGFDSRRYQIF